MATECHNTMLYYPCNPQYVQSIFEHIFEPIVTTFRLTIAADDPLSHVHSVENQHWQTLKLPCTELSGWRSANMAVRCI
uniref:Uncharacterized protein n=1 Tax=Arundo donax TaxID=35708 RepID=A0A0A9D015_ARUDO